jgi:hypothetical protein
MRKHEQEKLIKLLNKFAGNDDLYDLIDLLHITYRVTKEDNSYGFADFMRIQLADTNNK